MTRRNRCKAKLRLYPDPILKAVCEPVGDNEDVSGIIRDMMYSLTNSKTGVGLAAPQAGHTKRVILVSPNGFPRVMINPNITPEGDAKILAEECCLSYPGKSKKVLRHVFILTSFLDEKGRYQTESFTHWQARIIQHESDHLNGICKVGEQA